MEKLPVRGKTDFLQKKWPLVLGRTISVLSFLKSVISRNYSNDAKEADILDCCGLPLLGGLNLGCLTLRHMENQRTNGPVNAHLISLPSKAQNIQNLENIWYINDLDLQYSHTFINSISCLHLPSFRSLAAIVSEKSTVFIFPIEKPKLPNLTLL